MLTRKDEDFLLPFSENVVYIWHFRNVCIHYKHKHAVFYQILSFLFVAHLSTPVCHSEGLVCRRKLFQPTEGAWYCHQVLPESNPGELMQWAWCFNHLGGDRQAVSGIKSRSSISFSGGPRLCLCLHSAGSRVCSDRGIGQSTCLLSKRHQSKQQTL